MSDVVPDTSFRARDLVRGGEPVLIGERSATRTLKQWDRFAGRVVQVGERTQISGAVLPYEHRASEQLIADFRRVGKLTRKEKQEFAEAIGQDFDEAVIASLSETERLRMLSPMFTTFWLLDTLDRAGEIPDLRNFEGDELLLCTVCYPLADGTTDTDIRAVLDSCADLRPVTATLWNWVAREKRAAASAARARSSKSLTFETTLEDGVLSLGSVELEGRTLLLSVNSRERSELGRALLTVILGDRVGEPSVETTVEQMLASRDADAPQQAELSEQEQCAIIHDRMDRHYRDVLDQPVPMLGDKSPRAAVKTASGRAKVVDWLKLMENQTARAAASNSAMASYSFDWLWTELGIDQLRR